MRADMHVRRGFAEVEFGDVTECDAAVARLSNPALQLEGRTLIVERHGEGEFPV